MQLAALATILLYAYLLYALLFGGVSEWASLGAAERERFAGNVQNFVLALNISLGVLLLTSCVLYYDEESLGYALLAGAVALYFGVPFLFDSVFTGQLQEWSKAHNLPAQAIYGQFRTAAHMLVVPGVILVLRDLWLRVTDRASLRREEFHAMQYGGAVKEEAPPSPALIGMFARCWQLSFCRDAIRKRCPIYLARTKCWRQRVGCMCEENVIRSAMDALIHKEVIKREEPQGQEEDIPGLTLEGVGSKSSRPEEEPTVEFPKRDFAPPPPRKVKIPHNPNLPMPFKIERCRNCVIYNEHQRLKYQFFAPIVTLAVPALAVWKIDMIAGELTRILEKVDSLMASLSPMANPTNAGAVSSITQSSMVAQYVVIGCLIVITTSLALRGLEYLIFKAKI
jgi:hypothetical protein